MSVSPHYPGDATPRPQHRLQEGAILQRPHVHQTVLAAATACQEGTSCVHQVLHSLRETLNLGDGKHYLSDFYIFNFGYIYGVKLKYI